MPTGKPDLVTLTVDGFAAWRLAHLLIADSFPPVETAREAFLTRVGPDSALSYLAGCFYCTGVWVAGAVWLARRLAPKWWGEVAPFLALAAAVPLLENLDLKLGG